MFFNKWRKLVFVVGVVLVGSCFANAATHEFEMGWKATGFGTMAARLQLSDAADSTFQKEPDFAGRRVLRGRLDVGDEKKKGSVGFIWDKSEGKLLVDLNRDGDLTNDADGVLGRLMLENESPELSQFMQKFPELEISFDTETGPHRCRVQIFTTDAGRLQQALVDVVSGYEAVIELDGRQWSIGLTDSLTGTVSPESELVLSLAGMDPNLVSQTKLPQSLFLYDRACDLAFDPHWDPNGRPALTCRLTDKDLPVGSLRIECPQIRQLILGSDEMLVFPDLSKPVCDIPVGTYQCRGLAWGPQNLTPRLADTIEISSEREWLLRAGCPLTNSAKVRRVGNRLELDYQLTGAGGELYNIYGITDYDLDRVPSYAIYSNNGTQVASGKFEYG